jgi:hypothetical protein
MEIDELMQLVLDKHSEADNAIGRAIAAATGKDVQDKDGKETLLAVAISHITAAKALLELAIGPSGSARVFYHHADELATKAVTPGKPG